MDMASYPQWIIYHHAKLDLLLFLLCWVFNYLNENNVSVKIQVNMQSNGIDNLKKMLSHEVKTHLTKTTRQINGGLIP